MVAPAASATSPRKQRAKPPSLPGAGAAARQNGRAITPTLSDSSDENIDEALVTPSRTAPLASPVDPEAYFSSLNNLRSSSRANSVLSLSRISLSGQISQLTSLSLPNPSTLASNISSIPTAQAAATTLNNAADQIKKWLQKASEVLKGLDAEDDIEWAAAGGREGLEEVDAAIGKFEGLIGVYVSAIEELQQREDVSAVPTDQLKTQVEQMETILLDWDGVRKSLKGIKGQMELAMEWEELWNIVLGDIGLEMENLSRLVFEMEEARHKAVESAMEGDGLLDLQELDTIVEESPAANDRLSKMKPAPSLAGTQPPGSPLSPTLDIPANDSRLLALFARMQPLRASLDFLPMTLANFRLRAEKIFPSGCLELDSRKSALEKKWKELENDAQGLRQELGEDRWVLVFRNAGRQAQKLCDSVERTVRKVQEALEQEMQLSNPGLLAKKIEAYEAKKNHYGPAIKKVLSIIEKGVTDRQTVNGDILRVHLDTKSRWQSIEQQMKSMDALLDELNLNKSQHLRDSISSIMSMDRSVTGSSIDTPGSSPASSVLAAPSSTSKREKSPSVNGSPRNSGNLGSAVRSISARRHFSTPTATITTRPRKTSTASRPVTADRSPSRQTNTYSRPSLTPKPFQKPSRPSLSSDSNRPKWNSSPRVNESEYSTTPRPYPYSRTKTASTSTSRNSNLPLPSPLGRISPTKGLLAHRPKLSTGTSSTMGSRRASISTDHSRSPSRNERPPTAKRMSQQPPQRPNTSMAMGSSSRRTSMLPMPKHASVASPTHASFDGGNGRGSAMGNRTMGHGRTSSMGLRRT